MEFRFFEPWHDFLPRESGHVVAVAGAGAKGELLAACARALGAAGVDVAPAGDPDTDHDRLVLVQADADTDRPAARAAATRPVWPPRTSLALLVMGVDAVGSRAGEAVAGLEAGTSPPGAPGPDELLEWDHLVELVLGPDGYLESVPPEVPVVLALTGLADQPDAIGLFACVDRFMERPRLPIVALGDPGAPDDDAPAMRAACRAEDPEPDGG